MAYYREQMRWLKDLENPFPPSLNGFWNLSKVDENVFRPDACWENGREKILLVGACVRRNGRGDLVVDPGECERVLNLVGGHHAFEAYGCAIEYVRSPCVGTRVLVNHHLRHLEDDLHAQDCATFVADLLGRVPVPGGN